MLVAATAQGQTTGPVQLGTNPFGSVITQGAYDGGLDTRGLALANRYLGSETYPSPNGVWLHNSRIQVSGDTFGFGRNTTLELLCANEGPNCDAGSQGSFWDFGYRRAYGQEDNGVLALANTELPPLVDHVLVVAFTGIEPGHRRATFRKPLPTATFEPRTNPVDGLQMHPQLVAMTSNCFMGYITQWDPIGHWVEVDSWSRGAGNSCGGSIRTGEAPDFEGDTNISLSIGNVTSGVGLLYGVANTADSRLSRGAEFGEFTLSNSRTAEIRFSAIDPTNDEMDIGDGLGPKPFIDWGFMLGTASVRPHRYSAGTAILANGDWYRAFVSHNPAGDGAFIDMPRGGGNLEGASFRSYRDKGDVLVCSPPSGTITCKLDHAGNLQLGGTLHLRAPLELARLSKTVDSEAERCTPGALAYSPGARNAHELAGAGTGMPIFCNDNRIWVTLNNQPIQR